jgi:hypothetical protein
LSDDSSEDPVGGDSNGESRFECEPFCENLDRPREEDEDDMAAGENTKEKMEDSRGFSQRSGIGEQAIDVKKPPITETTDQSHAFQ